MQSDVIMNNCNPTWNCKAIFYRKDYEKPIIIEVRIAVEIVQSGRALVIIFPDFFSNFKDVQPFQNKSLSFICIKGANCMW